MTKKLNPGAEQARLQETRDGSADWKKWGPYREMRAISTERHHLVIVLRFEHEQSANHLSRYVVRTVGHGRRPRLASHRAALTVHEFVSFHLPSATLDPLSPRDVTLDDRLHVGGAHVVRERAGFVQ